jgi:hypothetical protein
MTTDKKPMASYTLTISTDSGLESTTEGRCDADQYSSAIAALHGKTLHQLAIQQQLLTQVIQRINASIYSLSKAEVITEIMAMRDELGRAAEHVEGGAAC